MSIPSAKECAIHGVTEQIKEFVSLVGIGFHPDTDFNDYINKATKQKSFKPKQAKRLNIQLNECFHLCLKYELDIYAISLQVMEPLLEKI